MIRYHLDMQPAPVAEKINYRQKLLFMGSCFSEHIAGKLAHLGFDVVPQPSGIVFNPVSLAKPFLQMAHDPAYHAVDLLHHDLWYSKFHHGSFSATIREELLEKLNHTHEDFKAHIKTSAFLFVTFGSAWVYKWIETGEIVANCHKIPQSNFRKELLEVADIVQVWSQVLDVIKTLNPDLQVVFTVSPVKHLRDGVVENTISKSILLVAIHELRKKYDVHYFPAFELVNDDLRDYRFYEQDGAHPNGQAIDYVFEKFNATYMDALSLAYIADMQKLRQMELHKGKRTEGVEYDKFQQRYAILKDEIKRKYGVDS
jgi:hypothetical protein